LLSLDPQSPAAYDHRALTLNKDDQSMPHSAEAWQSTFKRALLAISLLGIPFLSANCRLFEKAENKSAPASAERTAQSPTSTVAVHRPAIAIDMHADTPQRMLDEDVDLAHRLAGGQLDSVRAREGGLDAQFFSIWVEPQLFGGGGPGAIRRADNQIAAVRRLAERHPETWEVATSAGEIRRIVAAGKLAALLGLEGGYAIDERLENVERYYKLGVRYLSPTWSVSTSWAGSSGDEMGKARGLNEFGKQVIVEMNRLGMMIDVSHVSDKTFWDIIGTSRKPVIASHSASRAIAPVPRNLDDEMIRAVARTGGVLCVIFYPEFLEPGWSEKREQVDREIAPLVQRASEAESGDAVHKKLARDRVRREEYARRLPPVSVSRLVDHIDHIVKLVGVDHVGIGSDFDGVQAALSDLASVADLPNLTRELLRRGYTEQDVDKILGGNVLRVMEEVEKK
jgi:membrane dipeptidase